MNNQPLRLIRSSSEKKESDVSVTDEPATNLNLPISPTQSSHAPILEQANPLNEIREDFLLDEIQAFGDDYYWNTDSDLETFYEGVSQDYLDFLLSYE